jgi:hypothetical protein
MATFIFCFAAQALVLIYMIELLQRTQVLQSIENQHDSVIFN